MKKIITVLCLLFLSYTANSENICRTENRSWYVCIKNEDCVIVHDPCGYPLESSNKQSYQMAEKCNRIQGAAISCATWDEMKNGKTEAKCKSMTCVANKKTDTISVPITNQAKVFVRTITPIDKTKCFNSAGDEIKESHCVCYPGKTSCGREGATTCAKEKCSQWTCSDDKDCAQISAKCKEHFCKL